MEQTFANDHFWIFRGNKVSRMPFYDQKDSVDFSNLCGEYSTRFVK